MLHSDVAVPDGQAALLISPLEKDRDFLQRIFSEEGWTLYCVPSLGSALKFLRRRVMPAVITEADLPVGTWKEVLTLVRLLPTAPPVIVVALAADEHLWAKAMTSGARDVLVKPFNKAEVVRVLKSLWAARRAQPEPRSH